MAFGKIAVHQPDGEIVEVELSKPTTSVGRQPGNDIVLPTSAVSRYHAQFDVSEGQVYLVDLGTVNGTFVNDQQVEPNGRIVLNEGDEIMIGDMRLRFIAPEARSGSKRAVLNLNPEAVTVEAQGLPFRLILDEPQQSVAPGARLQMTLIIENLADYEYPVTIDLRGLDPEWAKTNRREAILEPGMQTQAMISVRPPRSSQTKPGLYPLTIRVALKEDSSKALEAVREVDIVGYAGLGVAIRPSRGGDSYHLAVQNQGNTPMSIRLEGYQRNKLLRFRFQPSDFILPPGETQQVGLTVRAASGRPFGAGREIPFAVVAVSKDGAGFQAPVMERFTLRPTWPAWLLGAGIPVIVGAVVVFGLVGLLLYFLGVINLPNAASSADLTATSAAPVSSEGVTPKATTGGPTPTVIATSAADIGEFTAEPIDVVYQTDGVVLLRWNAQNAEAVVLIGPGGREVPLRAGNLSTATYELPIRDLALGSNSYTLTITGADGQERSRSVVIHANAAVCVVVENAQPYSEPNPDSAPGPMLSSGEAVIIGRTSDAQWVRIAYNDLESLTIHGWLPYNQLTCTPGSPPVERYIVVQDSEIESSTNTTPTP